MKLTGEGYGEKPIRSLNLEADMKIEDSPDSLNSFQKRHLQSICEYVDGLLTDMESILAAAASQSPFQKYKNDVSPAQRKVVTDYLSRIRAQMIRVLESQDLLPDVNRFGAVHALRVTLVAAQVALQDLTPKTMRGYGQVPEGAIQELNGIVNELQGLAQKLSAYLSQGLGQDLQGRLARLEQTSDGIDLLKLLERIITDQGLVEFRPGLSVVVDHLERNDFEIALFGRVSSGKSSLLNYILQSDVLPVGVTPITAVPTRIKYGSKPRLTVWFANKEAEQHNIERLPEYVSELENSGNAKHVTRIVLEYPSPRLSSGVIFVDTPGLGSLATRGAAETLAYLPRCDLGVVLIDAGSTLTQEDLSTIGTLYQAAIPAMLLLSKADLLDPGEQVQSLKYIADHIQGELGLNLSASPVSVIKEHARTLEQWFEKEIMPLYDRHQELARQSLRRKIGSLSEAVKATLRLKLESAERRPLEGGADLKEVEKGLRKATGEMTETAAGCQRLADELVKLGDFILFGIADKLIELWRQNRAMKRVSADLVISILTQTTLETTGTIQARLETLARNLAQVLHQTAAALNMKAETMEGELMGVIREMPRLDVGIIAIDLQRPFVLAISKYLARSRIENRLQLQAGPQISEGLKAFGRTLEAWVRRAAAEMQRRFDAHADTYRAQLERLTTDSSSVEGREAIQCDLLELAKWRVDTEKSVAVPVP